MVTCITPLNGVRGHLVDVLDTATQSLIKISTYVHSDTKIELDQTRSLMFEEIDQIICGGEPTEVPSVGDRLLHKLVQNNPSYQGLFIESTNVVDED